MNDDMESARNIKLLLYLFEVVADLKINFHKSDALVILEDVEKCEFYADTFNCQVWVWPIKYLGVSVSGNILFHYTTVEIRRHPSIGKDSLTSSEAQSG